MATLSSKTTAQQSSTIATNLVNFLTNPSDANTWGVSSTGTGSIAVSTTTTAAELPLGPGVGTGIKIVSTTAGTKYVYARFTMPAILTTTKHMFEWFQKQVSGVVSGEWRAEVWYNAASDYSGAYTEVALSTDASGNTDIPALDGKFTTTFDGPLTTALYYEVRFYKHTGGSAATLALAQVLVGPGFRPQGAVVGDWVAYTPTFIDAGGTNRASDFNTIFGFWRRVGSTMEVRVSFDGAGAASSNQFQIQLPTGYTVDTSKLSTPTGNSRNNLGFASSANIAGGAVYVPQMVVTNAASPYDTTSVKFYRTSSSSVLQVQDVDDEFYCWFSVPIAEWAGSGVINVAQNDVEYAANSGATWDAAASAGTTVYGPGGQITGGTLTANRTKTVRFQTPIQNTDILILQFSDNQVEWISGGFQDAAQNNTIIGHIFLEGTASSGHAGVIMRRNSGAVTDVDVQFNRYCFMRGDGTGTQNWRSDWYWRVVKARAGAAVGFGEVVQSGAGLVKSAGQLKGTNTNDSAATGYVGEVQQQHFTAQNAGGSSTFATYGTVNLTAGDWDLSALVMLDVNGATTVTALFAVIGTGTDATGTTYGLDRSLTTLALTTAGSHTTAIPPFRVSLSGSQTYKLNIYATYASGTPQFYGRITARRVR